MTNNNDLTPTPTTIAHRVARLLEAGCELPYFNNYPDGPAVLGIGSFESHTGNGGLLSIFLVGSLTAWLVDRGWHVSRLDIPDDTRYSVKLRGVCTKFSDTLLLALLAATEFECGIDSQDGDDNG